MGSSSQNQKQKMDAVNMNGHNASKGSTKVVAMEDSTNLLGLLFGAGGIYACYLYYGTLQEEVTSYVSSVSGEKFKFPWLLNALEALANVILGGIGLYFQGPTPNLPYNLFSISGTFQVMAKAFTTQALSNGVSFPIVTLAKSGKMVPVMIGSILLGGKSYSMREYLSVAAIISGTIMVSMSKGKSGGSASSMLGLGFIVAALVCDGITGGMQDRIRAESSRRQVKAKPYDMMFSTNVVMTIVAALVAVIFKEITPGLVYCQENPDILSSMLKFAICSALGQMFIFYTISNFGSLTTTTVTTTRKVFSVLLSIFLKGHSMNTQGWMGIGVASLGILAELQNKMSGKSKAH